MLPDRPTISPLKDRTVEAEPGLALGIFEVAREAGAAVVAQVVRVCKYLGDAMENE
jgi:hypothetical protein